MEQHKIPKFLNDSTVLRFVTMKWIKVKDLSIFCWQDCKV